MYCAKYDFLAWLTNAWMKSINLADDDIKVIRKVSSHDAWLQHCGGDGNAVDISWQGFLKPSMRKLLSVVETIVFSTKEDAAWRNALKGSIEIRELVQAEPFKGLLAEVEALVVKEKPAQEMLEEATASMEPVVSLEGFRDHISEDAAAKLSSDQAAALDFSRLCDKRVDQFWTSVVDGKTRLELKTALENTFLSSLALKPDENILLWVDSKVAGEASSHPHLRFPPFGNSVLQKPLQAVLEVLKSTQALPSNMVVLISDGSRSIETPMSNQFKDLDNNFLKKNHMVFYIAYEEDSLKERKPTKGNIVQSEGLHMYVSDTNPPKIPDRPRCVYKGSTRGTLIGPVVVDQFSSPSVWKIDPKTKKEIYGPAKPLTGGPCPDGNTPKPSINGQEPVTFHGMPRSFYKEILHSWSIGCVINATESDGLFTLESIIAQKPVISILHTADHGKHLRKRLRSLMWLEMLHPKSALYEASLSLSLTKHLQQCCLCV